MKQALNLKPESKINQERKLEPKPNSNSSPKREKTINLFVSKANHFPLLLDSVNGPRGKRPFKFENMWLKNEGFGALVKQ